MAARYKIRARVQPFEVPQIPESTKDVELQEQRLLVPMDGSQTIGDLYYEIQRIYGDLYNKAGELRIRCLETEDGELLHTTLRISDCFERRIDSNASSQWTVVARRQALSPKELVDFTRNIRQFSFDDQSFARPQMPFSERLSIAPQEVSASPSKNQLTIRAPVQIDAADDIIPSAERENEPETRLLAVRRAQHSPTLVPNSQQAPDRLGDLPDTPQIKIGGKQIHPKASTISKTTTSKSSKAPALRKEVYDIETVDEPLETRKKVSPKQLAENGQSPVNRSSISVDGRPGAQKIRSPDHRSSSIQRDDDQSTAKLHASLAKERAEMQKLVANLPTTPSPGQSQKLTPFFPRSATKLTSGSKQPESITNATDTGTKLLQAETPLSLKTQHPTGSFAPDRFKEVDSRVLSFQSQQIPNNEGRKGASPDATRTVKAKPTVTLNPTKKSGNSDEVEDDEEAQFDQKKISDRSVDKRDNELDEISDEDEAIPNGISLHSAQKQTEEVTAKRKRGRPPKDPMAKPKEKATSPKDPLKSGGVPPEDGKLEEAEQPAKKKRGRPSGSTNKPKSDTEIPKIKKVKLVIDANGQPIKRGRGRPPGSKKKVTTVEASSPTLNSGNPVTGETRKKKPVESDTESDTEQSEANGKSNQKGSGKKTELNTSTDTGIRKRKADIDERGEESSKRAKNTAGPTGLANAGAMDESEDRRAVVSANDTKLLPSHNRETMRSYSRSPAQEVTTSSSEDSYDTDSMSEVSEQDASGMSQAIKTAKNKTSKASPTIRDVSDVKISSPLRHSTMINIDKTSNHVLIPRSRDENKKRLSPTASHLPSSLVDQAAAQLQSEDSASMTPLNNHKLNTPKRPVPSSSARSKYPSFSDIKHSQNIRSNPEFDQKMRQQPKNLKALSDDSSGSSDSDTDSDSDDAAPKEGKAKGSHSKKTQEGFHGLLNRNSKK